MIYLLYTLFILSCLVLIVAVLLQPGKADAGALFTSSVSSTAFGPRGTQTLLAKITIVAAAVFMLSALFISVPYFTGARSVLQSVGEEPAPATTPATQQTAPPAAPAEGSNAPAQGAAPAPAPSQGGAEQAASPAAPPQK